jgi:hypothetical protein
MGATGSGNRGRTPAYVVGIRVGGENHYFSVDSRTAAEKLAKTAATVHRTRGVCNGSAVYYGCVWIEGSQSASDRGPSFDEWKQRWARESGYSAQELAKLCCGWNPDSDVLPDPAAYNAALERILRGVRARDLSPIDSAVPLTREELFYGEGPLFVMRDAKTWAARYFPAFPFRGNSSTQQSILRLTPT